MASKRDRPDPQTKGATRQQPLRIKIPKGTTVEAYPHNDPNVKAIMNWIGDAVWRKPDTTPELPRAALEKIGINWWATQTGATEEGHATVFNTPLNAAVRLWTASVPLHYPSQRHPRPFLHPIFQVLLQGLEADPNLPDVDVFESGRERSEHPMDHLLRALVSIPEGSTRGEWLYPVASALVEYGATEYHRNPEWEESWLRAKYPKWYNLLQAMRGREEYAPGGKRYRATEASFAGGQLQQIKSSLPAQCADLQNEYNLTELRAMAKSVGLSGYSNKNKADLCKELAIVVGGYDGSRRIASSGSRRRTPAARRPSQSAHKKRRAAVATTKRQRRLSAKKPKRPRRVYRI